MVTACMSKSYYVSMSSPYIQYILIGARWTSSFRWIEFYGIKGVKRRMNDNTNFAYLKVGEYVNMMTSTFIPSR